MIDLKQFYFGDYKQKIILEDEKIKDVECNCTWGKNNQKAWKEGRALCKHVQSAIMHLDLKTKKELKKYA